MGSTREGRFGDTVARWFNGVAQSRDDMDVELIDLRDYPLRFLSEPKQGEDATHDDTVARWTAKVAAADGYVIVTPEYNHGYSAVLKNAIDHVYREWNNKPIGFVSYGGGAGGSRAMEQLRTVAIELQMAPIREGLTIVMPRNQFDEDGQPTDPAMTDRAASMLSQLAWWANALKVARASTLYWRSPWSRSIFGNASATVCPHGFCSIWTGQPIRCMASRKAVPTTGTSASTCTIRWSSTMATRTSSSRPCCDRATAMPVVGL